MELPQILMPKKEEDKTAAEYIDASMENLTGGKGRKEVLENVSNTRNEVLHTIKVEEGITAELRELTMALNELYEGEKADISPEIFERTWEHEAGNNKKLREFLRTAQAIFAAAKELRDFDKERGDNEQEFLEKWAEKVREKLQVDEKAMGVLKSIFLSDQPDFAQLANVLDAKRAAIYAKILPLEHSRFRAKIAKEMGKTSAEEREFRAREVHEGELLEASIGRILSEEETEKFKNYNSQDKADALYHELRNKKLLEEGSIVLLKFGGGEVYVSWETNANTAKANLRRELAAVQQKTTGPINHVQSWRKQKKYYDELLGGTTFTAISTVDGEEMALKKNKNGELSAKSVQLLKEKESKRSEKADPSSSDILNSLDHYIVNITPQNVEEKETE